MPMLFKLIEELDVAPTARAEVKVFPLKRPDAVAVETILQNLFFGTTTTVPGSGVVTNSSAGGTTTGAAAAPSGWRRRWRSGYYRQRSVREPAVCHGLSCSFPANRQKGLRS